MFFWFYRDLGLHALQNVGLFDPNALIHHNHEDICKNSLHLSNEQRRMCARSPRVFAVSFSATKISNTYTCGEQV